MPVEQSETDLDLGAEIGAAIDAAEASSEAAPKPTLAETLAQPAAEQTQDDTQNPEGEATETGEQPASTDDTAKAPDLSALPLSPELKDKIAKLPADAQAILLDRHKEMEADYTRKTQAISALKRDYEPVDQMLTPYRDAMRARGFTPSTLIGAWMNAENALLQGRGAELIAQIVNGYGIDRGKVAAALGIHGPQSADGSAAAPNGFDEIPEPLQKRLQAMEQGVFSTQQQLHQRALHEQNMEAQRINNDIQSFKGAKSDKGEVLHPYFDEVEADMTQLAIAERSIGRQPSLKELYERAVWANPSTRDRMLTVRTQTEQVKQAEEAKAKAARAKRAASSVTGAPASGQPQAQREPERSLRDEIASHFESGRGV